MWVGQLGGGDGLASGTIPDWIAPIMTAIHHLLVFHPAAPDPRSHETRARRGDSRAPGGAGSAGWKAAAPTSFSLVPHPALPDPVA